MMLPSGNDVSNEQFMNEEKSCYADGSDEQRTVMEQFWQRHRAQRKLARELQCIDLTNTSRRRHERHGSASGEPEDGIPSKNIADRQQDRI